MDKENDHDAHWQFSVQAMRRPCQERRALGSASDQRFEVFAVEFSGLRGFFIDNVGLDEEQIAAVKGVKLNCLR